MRPDGPRYRTVAEAMQAKGLTDVQVARLVGCHPSWVCRLRHGRGNRRLALPARLARVLEIPLESLAPRGGR